MSDTMKRMWTERQVRGMAVDSVEEKEKLEVFEHIVDEDGHKRFIEGDITLKTISGTTAIYGKWSLSGTHLMIVLAFAIADATDLSNKNLAEVNLPEWVVAKIVPLGSTVIAKGSFDAFASNNTTQSLTTYLETGVSKLNINTATFTANADRNVRIQFDLLIDDE